MGNIVLLDELTINKIAAGEVIERPASVIKEMVENSIDAGARNITVEIKNGGISLIRITDDGCGIAEDDMEIAFERHATSKIRKAEDLETVKSMGFRGEALASIAAIANVEMVSKKSGEEVAHRIVIEGGKVLEKSEAARSIGTTITVQNLFFNTPVRYKFLKKDYTEAGYIEDAITRIALINKHIAIKLVSNGKTIVQTNGNGDFQTVIYSIYGKDIASEIIEVHYTYEDMQVTGVIGKPVIARANRSNQLFFVNGRYVKDKNLTAATEQAYKGMIPVGRYGFVVLNLEMGPKMVDVNVHPAKLEVRFQEEGKVFKAIYHAIKSGLAKSELVENVENVEKEEPKDTNNVIQQDISKAINPVQNAVNHTHQELENVEEKKGFSGFLHKFLNEEETEEERNNNHLEEIFKFRKGIIDTESVPTSTTPVKEDTKVTNVETTIKKDIPEIENNIVENSTEKATSTNPIVPNERDEKNLQYDTTKIINQNEISKKVELEGTSISSDTRELDVTGVNDAIKEKTQEVLSTKFNHHTEHTQVMESIEKNAIEKTQVIEAIEKNTIEHTQAIYTNQVSDDTINTKEEQTDKTVVLSSNEVYDTAHHEHQTLPENTEIMKEETQTTDNSQDAFSAITEKLVEAKLSLENTQIVDTVSVREALKEKLEERNPEFDEMYKKTFGIEPLSVRKEKELENTEQNKINASDDFSYASENMNVFEDQEEYPEISYKFLGIAFSTYIIIEIKNEMYIIDQHAAHERIMYEKVKQNYYNEDVKDEQFLLLPDVITLTHKEMAIAKENTMMFAKAGFSFEEFGENTIKLTSVPSMCEDLNTKQLFLDILDEIDTVAVTARQEKEDKFIATVACKAAVKAKMKLDEKEVDSLMKKLLELPNPFTCPHGRPTAIKMTKYDLERKFSRK